MKTLISLVLTLMLLSGCAAIQDISTVGSIETRKIHSVAIAIHPGNSSEMMGYLQSALEEAGLAVEPYPPKFASTWKEVDALASYDAQWATDVVSYLWILTIELRDPQTGELLVIGRWRNSDMHGFPNAQQVMRKLAGDMVAKLKKTTATNTTR